MNKQEYSITKTDTGQTYNLPIFIEDNAEQLGIMVGFDGEISQVEEMCNFTYSGYSDTLIVYNTVNTNKLSFLIDSIFTVHWGDGQITQLPMTGINDVNLSSVSHTYLSSGVYDIRITLESPWVVNDITKKITIPFIGSFYDPTELGTLTFTIPYTEDVSIDQNYPTIDPISPTIGSAIGFQAVGKSRVDEFKLYGSGNQYSGLTIIGDYTGYTLNNLYYVDMPDGTTIITGNTEQYYDETIYNGMITRNEYFIGFVEDVTIYSDVFVERGQMGVMEKNLRLSEIDNMGELENYGNGYFNVRKQ